MHACMQTKYEIKPPLTREKHFRNI